ncbi:MAG: hypothetical protein LUE93_11700 [Bacteroides sp.]|nr:hypothetical protein [Bacteroides sp.]
MEVPVPAETGKTYVKVGLTPPGSKVQGRATGDHYDKTPSEEELLIYNYAVFIFNSNGILEATLTASPYKKIIQVLHPDK